MQFQASLKKPPIQTCAALWIQELDLPITLNDVFIAYEPTQLIRSTLR